MGRSLLIYACCLIHKSPVWRTWPLLSCFQRTDRSRGDRRKGVLTGSDTGVHGKRTSSAPCQTCRTVLAAPQLSVNRDCCGIVKSSGDFYCFCLRQAQNCVIDSSCLWADDAESQTFSLLNAMISFSFKFNLWNLKFHVLPFSVHLVCFVHLNTFYLVIFIPVSGHGVNHLGFCPFNLECKCTSSSARFSRFLCMWNNNARPHVCEPCQSFRLAQSQRLLECCEFQTERFFHQSWLLNIRKV